MSNFYVIINGIMKVFVTGATGFIGSHLIPVLIKKGYKVVVLVRSQDKARPFQQLKVKTVIGEISNPHSFINTLNQCDICIHLAAMRTNWGKEKDFYNINALAIDNIINAKTKLKHVIITSSVYAIGDLKKIPADESSPLCPKDIYGKSKRLLEERTIQNANKYNIPYTIIRPAIAYGPGDNELSFMNKLIRMVVNKKVTILGNGNNLIHLINIDDLINGYMKVIEKNGTNQVYILAGAKPIKLINLINIIKKDVRSDIRITKIPFYPALLLSYLIEYLYKVAYSLLPNVFVNEPLLLPIKVKIYGKNWYYNISKAVKELGFNPKVTYNDGISKIFISDKKYTKFII